MKMTKLSLLSKFIFLAIGASPLLMFSSCAEKEDNLYIMQKDLDNVKSILLACRAFAADSDGLFPVSDPDAGPDAPKFKNSTEVFNMLLNKGYIDAESVFWIPGNPDKPNPPIEDGVLTREENCYIFVAGQTETSYPKSPLVANEMKQPGHYGDNHPWLKMGIVTVGLVDGNVVQLPLTGSTPGATVQSEDRQVRNIFEEKPLGYLDTRESNILLP